MNSSDGKASLPYNFPSRYRISVCWYIFVAVFPKDNYILDFFFFLSRVLVCIFLLQKNPPYAELNNAVREDEAYFRSQNYSNPTVYNKAISGKGVFLKIIVESIQQTFLGNMFF